MLVLSRKVGEKILIGDGITITVVRVAQGTVRIGVEAPRDTMVVREEVAESLRRMADDAAAATSSEIPVSF